MYEDLEVSTQIGQVLAGKYRIDRVLGVGGMGIVVAATHLQLDQVVALKFIRREALVNSEVVSRFEREARAAVRLRSEHVARIIDVGRLESGSPYIVMEYLAGADLAELLQQNGAFTLATACDFVIQACDAIAEAHSLGIVHRDLKPGNLFLANTSHGQQIIKVLDFGISKSQVAGSEPSMTRTQAVMGSPGYMSPEQMRSTKNVDGRSDVWALGVILYELVAGRAPFDADTFTALCVKIAMDPHPPLPANPMKLPAGLELVVNRALEKDPARRFQSAIELAQALAPFASASGRERAFRMGKTTPVVQVSNAHQGVTGSLAETTLGAASGSSSLSGASSGRRKNFMYACAGIGAVILIGIGIALIRPEATVSGTARMPAHVAPAPIPGPESVIRPDSTRASIDSGVPVNLSAQAAPNDAGVEDAAGPRDGDHRKSDARAKPRPPPTQQTHIDPYDRPE